MKRKPKIKPYAVNVGRFGEARYDATSPQAARSAAWRATKLVKPDLSFAAFIKISSVRKLERAI